MDQQGIQQSTGELDKHAIACIVIIRRGIQQSMYQHMANTQQQRCWCTRERLSPISMHRNTAQYNTSQPYLHDSTQLAGPQCPLMP